MAVNGKVITGYSHPVYSVISSTGTRSCAPIARGVDVSIEIESSDNNIFYADNGIAESIGGNFTGGTLTLTVDGMLDAAENALFGRTAAGTDGWKSYKSTDAAPYVSVGFIVRYMSEGVTSYVPVVLSKVKFNPESFKAATQGENVEFQTQELTAAIFENASNVWKFVGDGEETEAAAITELETKVKAA